jgi:hypothetical protein
MSTVLAIDPGNEQSAFALIDAATCRPLQVDKVDNAYLSECLQLAGVAVPFPDVVAIEMVASYGMPVGREVFETCVWIGRFLELAAWAEPDLIYRRDVKLHLCQSSKAKDSNITQALVDRFASGAPNKGKGTKAAPGWFYGFRADIWQAYALAVLVADTMEGRAA